MRLKRLIIDRLPGIDQRFEIEPAGRRCPHHFWAERDR